MRFLADMGVPLTTVEALPAANHDALGDGTLSRWCVSRPETVNASRLQGRNPRV